MDLADFRVVTDNKSFLKIDKFKLKINYDRTYYEPVLLTYTYFVLTKPINIKLL